jgi:8-oxo-dGTP pyrophosphatase MutT (NUDIX family)
VLWRRGSRDGAVEVAVVHRPKYDDWTLPKGKLDPGETPVQAALREVAEETGHRAVLGEPLGDVRYEVNGRPKVVDYWAMEAADGNFVPHAEVDDIRWLPVTSAAQFLSYDLDREVLRRFVEG